MRFGEPFDVLNLKTYDAVIHSIEVCHQLRILHRDIRDCNILRFDGRCLLMDFDLSVILSEGQDQADTTLRIGSGQERSAPSRIRRELQRLQNATEESASLSDHYTISWTRTDDFLMFLEYAVKKGLYSLDL